MAHPVSLGLLLCCLHLSLSCGGLQLEICCLLFGLHAHDACSCQSMLLPIEYNYATVKYVSLVQAALQPGRAPCSCNKSKDSHGCICTAGVGAYSDHGKIGSFSCGALMLP